MSFKSGLKGLIGQQRINDIKANYAHGKNVFRNNSANGFAAKELVLLNTFQKKGYHTFFGYYDLAQMNHSKNKILYHQVSQGADSRFDKSSIICFDSQTEEERFIAHTQAWCWQQGARLKWKDNSDSIILFNDVTNNASYCTRIWDIETSKQVDVIPYPLYDSTKDNRYGVSVNFSRLQRLRPGYGYSILPDTTSNDAAPKDDGVFLVDMCSKQAKLLYSLHELASRVKCQDDAHHYINHVSFSPNGSHFMFFHIVATPGSYTWDVYLYVANTSTGDLRLLERFDKASHYTWKNNSELLVTAYAPETKQLNYVVYDLVSGEKSVINNDSLHLDGHPTYISCNDFITDTYPDDKSLQHLYQYDNKNDQLTTMLDIYADPRLYGEKRCDLHPRIHDEYILIDTSFQKKVRSICLFTRNITNI